MPLKSESGELKTNHMFIKGIISAQVDVETCVIIPVSTVWAVQTDRLDEWEICSVVDVVCIRVHR